MIGDALIHVLEKPQGKDNAGHCTDLRKPPTDEQNLTIIATCPKDAN